MFHCSMRNTGMRTSRPTRAQLGGSTLTAAANHTLTIRHVSGVNNITQSININTICAANPCHSLLHVNSFKFLHHCQFPPWTWHCPPRHGEVGSLTARSRGSYTFLSNVECVTIVFHITLGRQPKNRSRVPTLRVAHGRVSPLGVVPTRGAPPRCLWVASMCFLRSLHVARCRSVSGFQSWFCLGDRPCREEQVRTIPLRPISRRWRAWHQNNFLACEAGASLCLVHLVDAEFIY